MVRLVASKIPSVNYAKIFDHIINIIIYDVINPYERLKIELLVLSNR